MKGYLKLLTANAIFGLALLIPNSALADGDNSGPGSGGDHSDGDGNHSDRECELEAEGKGFILVGESNRFHFEFKFEFEDDEIEAEFNAFDQESGICIRACRVIGFEKIDDHTLVIDLEAVFNEQEKQTISIKITDGGPLGPDTFELTLADGTTISGEVIGCIEIENECEEKCKGRRFCKGHPKCDEHPFCEVPNCKGHKKCKKENCTGHPECRKNFKHKKGCKAKFNFKKRCSCKTLKR